jgi:hypothetical protein
VIATGPNSLVEFNPGRDDESLEGDKHLQHILIRRGSKGKGPMPYDFTACKRILRIWNKYFVDKIHHFLGPDPSYLLLDGSVCRIA